MRAPANLGRRLAVSMVAVTAAATLAAGIAAWLTTRGLLIATIDSGLRERAQAFVRGGVHEGLLTGRFPTSPGRSDERDSHLVIIDDAGIERFRSDALAEAGDLAALVRADGPVVATRLGDGTPLRLVAVQAPIRTRRPRRDEGPPADTAERRALVVLTQSTAAVEGDLYRLAAVLGGLWVLSCSLAGLAAWSLRRAILRPVERLAHAIGAIDPATLHPRPMIADAPAELASVVQRLDRLLARVDDVLAREKATIGAIAHELRTPVAGLRTTLEFASARTRDSDAQATYQSCLDIIVVMQAQIETLLRLTRLEAGAERIEATVFDLVALLRDTWAECTARADARGIQAQWRVPETLVITSGAEALRTIARNVLGNAIDHAPHGAVVTIALAVPTAALQRACGWTLSVANPSDLTDTSRVFEPFWRADPARGSGHSGLGLALCQRLGRLLGLSVNATATGETFLLTISQGVVSDVP